MIYKIFKDGEHINTIVASEEFVSEYCSENGYTYEEEIREEPTPEVLPSDHEILPSDHEILMTLLGVNE